MPPYVKTEAELREELREQVAALRASSAAYDAGERWEATRLAATAYILLHDGGRRSQSLLTRLNLRRELSFISSVKPDAPLPLAKIDGNVFTGEHTYSPLLGEFPTTHRVLRFSQ